MKKRRFTIGFMLGIDMGIICELGLLILSGIKLPRLFAGITVVLLIVFYFIPLVWATKIKKSKLTGSGE